MPVRDGHRYQPLSLVWDETNNIKVSGTWLNAAFSSVNKFAAAKWYQLTLARNGSVAELNIDNVLEGSGTVGNWSLAGDVISVGDVDESNTAINFHGRIDNVRLYLNALTAGQRYQDANDIPLTTTNDRGFVLYDGTDGAVAQAGGGGFDANTALVPQDDDLQDLASSSKRWDDI